MEAVGSALVVLLRFFESRAIDVENRLRTRQFFKVNELDDLRDFVQRKMSRLPAKAEIDRIFNLQELEDSTDTVSKGTLYARLTTISGYLDWLARYLLDEAGSEVIEQIDAMTRKIKERRPKTRGRNDDGRGKSLSDEQMDVLLEVTRPGSRLNPYTASVQQRNRLMILLLYHLGIRGGELLNIRIRDISFDSNQIEVVRRADEKDDSRANEPNAKTLGRILPLNDALVRELHGYIVLARRRIRNANRHDFLFVTHKYGPTEGSPMSKSALYKMLSVLRYISPHLYALSGHKLRHTWNRKFSEKMDGMDNPPPEARQEQIRAYLMGWKQGSGTAATYNKRFVENKGFEAALSLQATSGSRAPKRADNENE